MHAPETSLTALCPSQHTRSQSAGLNLTVARYVRPSPSSSLSFLALERR